MSNIVFFGTAHIFIYILSTNKYTYPLYLKYFLFFFLENHRTQSQYDRHRVTKLVLFEFVNNFVCLFYIAFYIQDMEMLRSQLQTMLIISQAINNFQETVQPLAIKYYTIKVRRKNIYYSLPYYMRRVLFWSSNNLSICLTLAKR